MSAAPRIIPSVEWQAAIRRTDWRFLLPPPPAGTFEHLVLLGGSRGDAEAVIDLGVARHVSTSVPAERCADVVVRLHDGEVDLASAAGCLCPGGMLYAEVDRHRPHAGASTPGRVRRELRDAGLEPLGVFWVRKSFRDRSLYLPAEVSAAITWYFANAHHSYSRSWRDRAVRTLHRLAAAAGPAAVERLMRCYAVTAVRGDAGPRSPSVLAVPGLPAGLRGTTLRPIVIAPRLRRVALLPFAPGASRPCAVLKVSRSAEANARTANEQRTLAEVRCRLREHMRESVPAPLGDFRWGGLLVGAESCIQGRVLAHPRHPWMWLARRTHVSHLRAVTAWLCEFHRQTRVQWRRWGVEDVSDLEAMLGAYRQAFGLTPDEGRLFAETCDRARSLEGMSLPVVWRHGDLNPKNICRTARGIAIVDWEEGSAGLPLLDLLWFMEEWLNQFPGAPPDLEGKASRFYEVFLQQNSGDPVTKEIRGAIRRYTSAVGLALPFYPVLQVMLWTGAAVRGIQRAQDLDQDDITRSMLARHLAAVRAVARNASRPRAGDPCRVPAGAGGVHA